MKPFTSKTAMRSYFENCGFPVLVFDAHVLPFRRIDELKRVRLEEKLAELNRDA